MTVPVWVLLLFAAWTLMLLFLTVGFFRWSRILAGRATIREWRPDEDQGTDRYRRAMRAHANCLENLPIYIVVVIALLVTEAKSPWLDGLAIILLIARIAQSALHLGPTQDGARRRCTVWLLLGSDRLHDHHGKLGGGDCFSKPAIALFTRVRAQYLCSA
jgi:uncharacterized MAPEG superfamily protein